MVQEEKVGKFKVTGFMGEHYFSADVIEGRIKIGDPAKKGASAMLIQSGE